MVSVDEIEFIKLNINDIKEGYFPLCSIKSLVTTDFVHCTSCPYRGINNLRRCKDLVKIDKLFKAYGKKEVLNKISANVKTCPMIPKKILIPVMLEKHFRRYT